MAEKEGSWKGRALSEEGGPCQGRGLGVGPVFCPPLFFVSFLKFFIYLIFWFLVALHDVRNLNSQTRDPCIGSAKALPAREVPESLF